jgi:hypothetical protein
MMRKASLAVLLLALLASGCSTVDTDSHAPSVTTSVDPTESVVPTESVEASPSAVPSKKPAAGSYPTTAKAYGAALLSAWGAKNTARVAQLATAATILQLRDPQSQDKTTWTTASCDATGESTVCLYRNGYGDNVTLSVTTAALGRPTAVTEALLERTEYAKSRTAYASAFVAAWQSGNTARMSRLATSDVVSFFKSREPFKDLTTVDMGTKVRIMPASAGGGSGTYDLTVDEGRLGSAHAIIAAATVTG